MYETLIKPHEVNQIPTLLPIGEVSEKLKRAEQKREEKRLRQIANARIHLSGKRKAESLEAVEDTGNKRVKTDDEDETGSRIEAEISETNHEPPQSSQIAGLVRTFSPGGEAQHIDIHMSTKINVSKAMPEVRGHTSYLTFACLVPAAPSEGAASATIEEVGPYV